MVEPTSEGIQQAIETEGGNLEELLQLVDSLLEGEAAGNGDTGGLLNFQEPLRAQQPQQAEQAGVTQWVSSPAAQATRNNHGAMNSASTPQALAPVQPTVLYPPPLHPMHPQALPQQQQQQRHMQPPPFLQAEQQVPGGRRMSDETRTSVQRRLQEVEALLATLQAQSEGAKAQIAQVSQQQHHHTHMQQNATYQQNSHNLSGEVSHTSQQQQQQQQQQHPSRSSAHNASDHSAKGCRPSTDGEAAHAMLTQAVRPLSADEYEVRGGAASDQQDRAESGHRAAPAAHQSSLQDDDPPASAARDRHTGMQGREGRAEVRGVRGMGGAGQNPNEAQHGWGVSSINAPNLAPSGLVVEEPAGAGDGPAAKPFRSVPQPGRHHAPTMSNSKSGAHWHSRGSWQGGSRQGQQEEQQQHHNHRHHQHLPEQQQQQQQHHFPEQRQQQQQEQHQRRHHLPGQQQQHSCSTPSMPRSPFASNEALLKVSGVKIGLDAEGGGAHEHTQTPLGAAAAPSSSVPAEIEQGTHTMPVQAAALSHESNVCAVAEPPVRRGAKGKVMSLDIEQPARKRAAQQPLRSLAAAGAAARTAAAAAAKEEQTGMLSKGSVSQRDRDSALVVTDRNGSLINVGGGPDLHKPILVQQSLSQMWKSPLGSSPPQSSRSSMAGVARAPAGSTRTSGGLQLWSGNKSQAQVVRLGVRLIQAAHLSRSSFSQIIDPFATVKCEKAKFVTKAIAKSTQPYWDEFFVFEVRSPAFAVLRVKVLDHLSCWRPALVGELRVPIKFLADHSAQFSQPAWHTLQRRSGSASHGKIQMQCFYLQERVHRPLNVMCCTWNVGNAAPPDDLSPWLKGVDKQAYDLVAVGVQECAYKLRGSFKDDDDDDFDDGLQERQSQEDQGLSLSFASHTKLRQPSCPILVQPASEGGWANSTTGLSRHASQVESRMSSHISMVLPSNRGDGSLRATSLQLDALEHASSGGRSLPPHAELQPSPSQQQHLQQDVEPTTPTARLKRHRSGRPLQGKQQKMSLKEVDVGGGKVFQKAWEDHVKRAMGDDYWMARSVHMGQIRLLLFARNDMYAAISNIEKAYQATGVGGVATNKGGVAIAVQVWDTELCFVNCHLAAHQDKTRSRNAQYSDIVKGIRMGSPYMDILTEYHHVFWMGDLNYRLDYGSQATNPTKTPAAAEHAALVADIENGRWTEILATDQLRKEQAASRAFLRFQEKDPLFAPTFKVERRKGLHYKHQRLPAYCDRVLFRSNLPLKQIKATEYFQTPDITTSDHKPVAATFVVPTVWGRDEQTPTHKLTLDLHRLSIADLCAQRKRKPGSLETSSLTTLNAPNPQVIIMGSCLAGRSGMAYSTSVAHATNCPVWDCVITLHLKPAAIQDLAHRRLLVRVVDVVKDGLGKGQSTTLARGVLPLTAAAMQLLQSSSSKHPPGTAAALQRPSMMVAKVSKSQPSQPAQPVQVEVPLEYNGLPAGTLSVHMSIGMEELPQPRKSGGPDLFSRVSARNSAESERSGRRSGSFTGALWPFAK